jgi:PAS domain S-box-containing protein
VHPDDLPRCFENWNRALETGKYYEIEFRLKNVADGIYRWHLGRALPMHEHKGQIVNWFGTNTDIDDYKRVEETLRINDRAMAAASNGIVITDASQPGNPIIYCNPAFERMTGYLQDEILGHNCRFLQGPDTDLAVRKQIRHALRQEHECQVTLKNYRKDGTFFWNELTISPVKDTSGKLTHFIGVQSDITERKQAEEALLRAQVAEAAKQALEKEITERKQAETALNKSKRRLQNQNTVLMELTKRKTLYSGINLNIAFREITEAATNTLRIERASVWLYSNDRSKIQCIDLYEWSTSCHSQGIELAAVDYPAYFQALNQERTIAAHDAHTDPRTKEFSEFYLSVLGITSMLDAPIWLNGEMVGIVCHEQVGPVREWELDEQNFAGSIADLVSLVMKDSKRKLAEVALEESEKRYRSIVNDVKEVIFQTNMTGIWTFLNPAWQEITGFTLEESLDTNFLNYIHPEDCQYQRDIFQSLIKPERQIDYYRKEVRYLTKDGSFRWIEVYACLTRDAEDNVIGTSGTLNDITERKRAEAEIRSALEKEKELGELKSRFVSTTSHEFRTPLSTILSSSEILKRYNAKLSDEQKLEHLERIQVTVTNMTHLLDDVLLIGQAEMGKLEIKPTPLNLIEFCRYLIEEIQVSTDTHAIAFCSSGQYTTACLDEKLLRHILINLLSNAIKYSPQGGTIHFELIGKQQQVIFRVQDEGIGIPAADQANLFESFHRASNVGTISGTGLGLAIVKKSVDLHGGKIAVTSAVGVGTTFTVTIPLHSQIVTDEKDFSKLKTKNCCEQTL